MKKIMILTAVAGMATLVGCANQAQKEVEQNALPNGAVQIETPNGAVHVENGGAVNVQMDDTKNGTTRTNVDVQDNSVKANVQKNDDTTPDVHTQAGGGAVQVEQGSVQVDTDDADVRVGKNHGVETHTQGGAVQVNKDHGVKVHGGGVNIQVAP